MKRTIALLLLIVLTFVLSACTGEKGGGEATALPSGSNSAGQELAQKVMANMTVTYPGHLKTETPSVDDGECFAVVIDEDATKTFTAYTMQVTRWDGESESGRAAFGEELEAAYTGYALDTHLYIENQYGSPAAYFLLVSPQADGTNLVIDYLWFTDGEIDYSLESRYPIESSSKYSALGSDYLSVKYKLNK